MPRLTDAERNNAIGRLEAGVTQQTMARHVGVSRQTISALWTRYNNTRRVNGKPRSGRRRSTVVAEDRYIRVRHLPDRTTTATSTTAQIPGRGRISYQTVRNRLREAGLFARRPVRRNVLTDVCGREIHHLRHFQSSLWHSSMSGRPPRNMLLQSRTLELFFFVLCSL